MPRRAVLTHRQRAALFGLPNNESMLVRHCLLSDADLVHIGRRRRPQNRLGFALQLCALRYPGRLIQPGEVIPERMLGFIGAQLGIAGGALLTYGAREATRYQHSAALQHPRRSAWRLTYDHDRSHKTRGGLTPVSHAEHDRTA